MSKPISPPIHLSSAFLFEDTASMKASLTDRSIPLYSRWSNPTTDFVEQEIARLEGAEQSLLVASGMAAVHLALHTATQGATAILAQRELYGGTDELLRAVPWPQPVQRVGVDELIEAARRLPSGAVVYCELPTNPAIRLVDLRALRAATDATIVVDATFASPALLRPLEHGADLVLHSATKYLGGHHDLTAGVLSGSAEWMERAWGWRKLFGPTLDPSAAWRIHRGLQTLDLRVRRASESAAVLAAWLDDQPAIAAVHHPSRPGHPDHALCAELLGGQGGGVMAFVLTSGNAAPFLDRLARVGVGVSLGGTHTLATTPDLTHAKVPAADRLASGLVPGLVRLSVGLEPVDELIADLAQALGARSQ